MKVWAVFIRQSDSGGVYVCRWIDSQWAEARHATSRKIELEDVFKSFGICRHDVFITSLEIADAAIQPENPDVH